MLKIHSMKIDRRLTRAEFHNRFPSSDDCYRHLAEQKWGPGYRCKRCDRAKYCNGVQPHGRRCTGCRYDESPTAGTMFHKLKFNLHTAFEMLYEIATSKKGANSVWLAERYGLSQKTTWLFRAKAQLAMTSSRSHSLDSEVHVDEFELGTPKSGRPGRSGHPAKVKVVLAIEHRNGKPGRGYAQVITDYSAASLRPIFEQHIGSDAEVVTDGWAGYLPMGKGWPKLRQELSDQGRNFKMLHLQIRNIKNWLRGVHSFCAPEYVNRYLQEYFYRFNRRHGRANVLQNLLERAVCMKPTTYADLRLCAT